MVGLKTKDLDRDIVMIFVICYEYSISFTNMLKLFQISRKYFWTFMEICSPMIKMGVRKAACLRKTVDKIMECLKTSNPSTDGMTVKEEKIFQALTWFLEDSFSDGESCLHISQLQAIPFAKGFSKYEMEIASDFKGLLYNLDRLSYVEIAGHRYYKTSRFMFYLEKYSGNLEVRELNNLSVKDMIKKISEGEERIREKENQELLASKCK